MNELALFAGAGGGILGGKLLGWRTVCAVEIDAFARSVLLARQREGFLAAFPIWDDVTTFDGRPWNGFVDVVSGGFPCQDISAAGTGGGIRAERSGLWAEFARIIGEVQPRFVWVENSPVLIVRGLDVVCGDLAALGYDATWGVVGAQAAGAPQMRDRIWILAYANGLGRDQMQEVAAMVKTPCTETGDEWNGRSVGDLRKLRGGLRPIADDHLLGVAERHPRGVEQRFRVVGNTQVPAVVRLAWGLLMTNLEASNSELNRAGGTTVPR